MTGEELQKQWIPHLKGQFERGRPILFTGAGFSLDVKNIAGEAIPSYRAIKKAIWQLSFPDDTFDETSGLKDLYEHALQRHRKELTELLLQSFSIDSKAIPSWYRRYAELPWQRIYTLNIDDLDIAFNSALSLPRPIVAVS